LLCFFYFFEKSKKYFIFFEKTIDKTVAICYNTICYPKTAGSGKSLAFLPRRDFELQLCESSFFAELCLPEERFFYSSISHWEVKRKMPSNSILVQKQQIVANLAEQIKNSTAGVIVNYQGITVENDTAMRKALREAGVKYVVMKNTMTGRACDIVGYGELKQYLNGMTAIAISDNDPVVAAKILKTYAEKVESFSILGGYVDGAVIDANTVNELAEIPAKEVLIAKLLGSIQSPLYKFAYAIKAICDKENGEEAPAEAAAEA
jgi:large subunit ribosomal protein L10